MWLLVFMVASGLRVDVDADECVNEKTEARNLEVYLLKSDGESPLCERSHRAMKKGRI